MQRLTSILEQTCDLRSRLGQQGLAYRSESGLTDQLLRRLAVWRIAKCQDGLLRQGAAISKIGEVTAELVTRDGVPCRVQTGAQAGLDTAGQNTGEPALLELLDQSSRLLPRLLLALQEPSSQIPPDPAGRLVEQDLQTRLGLLVSGEVGGDPLAQPVHRQLRADATGAQRLLKPALGQLRGTAGESRFDGREETVAGVTRLPHLLEQLLPQSVLQRLGQGTPHRPLVEDLPLGFQLEEPTVDPLPQGLVQTLLILFEEHRFPFGVLPRQSLGGFEMRVEPEPEGREIDAAAGLSDPFDLRGARGKAFQPGFQVEPLAGDGGFTGPAEDRLELLQGFILGCLLDPRPADLGPAEQPVETNHLWLPIAVDSLMNLPDLPFEEGLQLASYPLAEDYLALGAAAVPAGLVEDALEHPALFDELVAQPVQKGVDEHVRLDLHGRLLAVVRRGLRRRCILRGEPAQVKDDQ
ncbi:MAG TPA: hypothetical protein VF756_05900 [Thermoanaerobaculia bacterium]